MTSSLMNRYYKGSAIEYDEQNAVKMVKQKLEISFIVKITRTINKLYCTTFY